MGLRAEPRQPPVERENAKEFVDSLSENVLTNDPGQIYRRNGARREIDLLRGLTASLDETANSRLGSCSPLPGLAQAPGRTLSLDFRQESWAADVWYRKLSTGRENGADANDLFAPGWLAAGALRQQRNYLLGEHRRDDAYELRWQAAQTLRLDAGWHRARLTPFEVPVQRRAAPRSDRVRRRLHLRPGQRSARHQAVLARGSPARAPE